MFTLPPRVTLGRMTYTGSHGLRWPQRVTLFLMGYGDPYGLHTCCNIAACVVLVPAVAVGVETGAAPQHGLRHRLEPFRLFCTGAAAMPPDCHRRGCTARIVLCNAQGYATLTAKRCGSHRLPSRTDGLEN
jgi:hypothetical protein